MEIRGRWLILSLFFLGCDTDFFPEGLYDYQVERLLSGGEQKIWNRVINSENCQDSTKLLFTLISNLSDDSVFVQQLRANEACSGFDTTDLGNADASSFVGTLPFTDSLNFADGLSWIIRQISSENLEIEEPEVFSYIQP